MDNIIESKYTNISNKNVLDKYLEFIVDSIDKLNIKTEKKISNHVTSKYNNNNSYYEIITTKIYEYFPSFAPSLSPSLSPSTDSSPEYINADHIKQMLLIFAIIVILILVIIKYRTFVDLIKSIYKK